MASIEEKNLIIDENLQKNDESLAVSLEKRAAHIAERAALIGQDVTDDPINACKLCFVGERKPIDCILDNKKYVDAVFDSVSAYDKLNFAEHSTATSASIFFSYETETQFDADTVVYLKNPLADIAYNNFSKFLNDPRARYEDSFSDVCEEVYYSRAPYCILPTENSEEGRLAAFGNMIRKYELKIVLTYSVENANGKVTRFALLKRELAKIECKSSVSEGEFVEIGLRLGEDQMLHRVLAAANYFGFNLNKIDSLPIYYSEKEYYFDVVFKGNGKLDRFLFWLELEVPGYEIIGIYTQIKTVKNRHGGHYG